MEQISEQCVTGHHVLEAAMQRSAAGFGIVDRRQGLIFANPVFTELAGRYRRQGGKPPMLSVDEGSVRVEGHDVLDLLNGQDAWQATCAGGRSSDGEPGCFVSIVSLDSPPSNDRALVEVHPPHATDASTGERVRRGELDELTGLPTLRAFKAMLGKTIAKMGDGGGCAAVLFVDLDGFKLVNDTSGHAVGNDVLKIVGARIRQHIRRSDLAARAGGDEFVVLLPAIGGAEDAGRVANAILDSLSAPIGVCGHKVHIGASIGIAVAPVDATETDTLLEMADAAMYRVKRRGRNGFEFYGSSCAVERTRRSTLERDLRAAVETSQLVMYYQPIIDVRTGMARLYEALIRWRHPERGLLLPEDFLPFLEETGAVCQIGDWVVGQVAADMGKIVRSGRPDTMATINIDPRHWVMGDLGATLDRAVAINGIGHKNIALEIVENNLMHDLRWSRDWLQAIRDRGTEILLDDFGAGHAAFNYFMELPFDFVKIDRSILKRCPKNRVSLTLIQSVKFIARQLGIEVVAEGVETSLQHEIIKAGGIGLAQGYHYCRPMPFDRLYALLQDEADHPRQPYFELSGREGAMASCA